MATQIASFALADQKSHYQAKMKGGAYAMQNEESYILLINRDRVRSCLVLERTDLKLLFGRILLIDAFTL